MVASNSQDGSVDEDLDGFCDQVVSVNEVLPTENQIKSVEYFDLTGRKINYKDLENHRIYIKKIVFLNEEILIQKIIKT